MLVALASVLVTGAATLGLFRQGARDAARTALARDADLAAAALVDAQARRGGATVDPDRVRVAALRQVYASRGVEYGVMALPGQQVRARRQLEPVGPPFADADAAAVASQGTLSETRRVAGREWFVEGRAAGAVAVLVAAPADQPVAGVPPRRRLVLPLLLGLAGGGLAGLLLARQVARPIRRLAEVARRLSAGQRDVRADAHGPIEVADAAQALNGLAAALAGSEARQRRFLLDVSHELRTPLTAVAGYAEGLADGVLTGAEATRAGEVIRDEAARLERRVEDLLALARTEAADFRIVPAPADLAEVVTAAAQAWRPRAQAVGVRLGLEAGEPVVVVTDAERVRQAVDALADNALRVLPAGAPLILACRTAAQGPGTAAGAVVEVRDGGPGLDPDELAIAFDRGRLTERFRGERPVGSGLGLALVAELARRLGGRAEAVPAAEGGVAFRLLLPAASPRAADPNIPRTIVEPRGHLDRSR
jgi:two-component system sensor histidine kinase BaeS